MSVVSQACRPWILHQAPATLCLHSLRMAGPKSLRALPLHMLHSDMLSLLPSMCWPQSKAPFTVVEGHPHIMRKMHHCTHPDTRRAACRSTHNMHPELVHMQACLQPRQLQPRRLLYFWPAGQVRKEGQRSEVPGTEKPKLGVWEGLLGPESCGMKLLWMLCWTGMSEKM